MLTNYPTPLATWEPEPLPVRTEAQASAPIEGSWRYEGRRMSRVGMALALAISAGAHVTLLFGAHLLPKKVVVVKHLDEAPVIRLAIPELKDLEEPEKIASDEVVAEPDLAIPVPMQADLPALPQPNDFVQPLNFASLLEQPDLSQANLSVIPDHFTRASRIAESIGKIFNLEDLDRHPEPVLQPSPTYPFAQRRDGLSATVILEFIVDVQGRILEPVVIDSTHSAFNDAAITGVSRWKFKAGMKGGKKVNVRMRVPIVFKVLDNIDE